MSRGEEHAQVGVGGGDLLDDNGRRAEAYRVAGDERRILHAAAAEDDAVLGAGVDDDHAARGALDARVMAGDSDGVDDDLVVGGRADAQRRLVPQRYVADAVAGGDGQSEHVSPS
jgi:hypothetical protein